MAPRVFFGFFLMLLGAVVVLFCACDQSGDDSHDDTNDTDDDDSGNADDDSSGDDDSTSDDDSTADDDTGADDDTFVCNVTHSSSTVGLISCLPGAYEGYTLLAPTVYDKVYLLNMFGRVVNIWDGLYTPGQVVYLLENGQLLRTGNTLNPSFFGGGIGGLIELQEWDGTVSWQYRISTSSECAHHDVRMLPNGNILAIVWEKKTNSEAIQAGRNPAMLQDNSLWPDYVVELEPVGTNSANVVWEWHVWDHLIQDFDSTKDNYGVVENHPKLVDVNFAFSPRGDWLHTNAVDYNEEFDQIIISIREFSEVWVIDHSTTTEEAASHSGGRSGRGGDLLYRWGNPSAFRATLDASRVFYSQHNAYWIEDGLPGAGHIMVFNNGTERPDGKYSTVDEFVPAVDEYGVYESPDPAYGPDALYWTYAAANPTDMFSMNMGGAQRLANGNTLICNADNGHLYEVTSDGDIVWEYINPVTFTGVVQQGQIQMGKSNEVFRVYRYPPEYPGFEGRDLTPGDCLVEPCE